MVNLYLKTGIGHGFVCQASCEGYTESLHSGPVLILSNVQLEWTLPVWFSQQLSPIEKQVLLKIVCVKYVGAPEIRILAPPKNYVQTIH